MTELRCAERRLIPQRTRPSPAAGEGRCRIAWCDTIKRLCRDDGASLVETALSLSVYLMLLIGVLELLLALYSYHFVSDAAREATRYAVIRGANSCYPNPAFPNCNLGPASISSTTNPSRNPVLQYIDSIRYPGLDPNNLSADVTWWISRQNVNGNTSWTTQCSGQTDAKGNACNAEGNAVRVVVTYNYPLTCPGYEPLCSR